MIILNTRTSNSIYNIISTIIPYFIIGVLGFIKIRVFVNNLETDIVSINQLFFQILSYLALAEAGFGVFIIQKYYKAFSENNHEEINKIYSTSRIYFKRVGFFILGVAFILSFFVHFLTKADISNGYIQLVFIIFIIKNSVDYFMMSPRFVIQSDQKMYKINGLVNSIRIIEAIVEIALAVSGVDYLIILIPGIPIRIFINWLINKKVYKEYPWLTNENKFYNKYIKGISNIITQKIVGIFYSNTDIILLSTFVDPLRVVIYTSYNYITKFVFDTVFVGAQAIGPSYANALNTKSKDESYQIFTELNIMFYFLAVLFTVFLSIVLNSLIILWVGEEYLINNVGLYLVIGIMYVDIARRMMYLTINSKGLFKETKMIIIVEAVLNFIISIVLVHKFGINGVLFGTLISMLLTTTWYFPKFILKTVFDKKLHNYFPQYLICFGLTVLLVFVFSNINLINMNTVLTWILGCLVYGIILIVLLFIIFLIFFKSFRNLYQRGLYLLKSKLRRIHEKN